MGPTRVNSIRTNLVRAGESSFEKLTFDLNSKR